MLDVDRLIVGCLSRFHISFDLPCLVPFLASIMLTCSCLHGGWTLHNNTTSTRTK